MLRVTPHHLQSSDGLCLNTPSWYCQHFFLSEENLILHCPVLHKPAHSLKNRIKASSPQPHCTDYQKCLTYQANCLTFLTLSFLIQAKMITVLSLTYGWLLWLLNGWYTLRYLTLYLEHSMFPINAYCNYYHYSESQTHGTI